jgi:peptide/nickel transport system substrate-binding protein/oligopeptide transport system substrate-binding protein
MKNTTVVSLASLALLLSACGGKPAGEAASSTGDLVVSIGISEPKNLVPSHTTEENGSNVLHALFTGLVEWDDNLQPQEVAAESVSSTDNRVWTITLKPGWTFHNGEPVTADSYINAWNAGAWGPNAHDGNYFFDKILGYEAMNPLGEGQNPTATKLAGLVKKDELTFEVTLKEPYVNFKSMIGYTAFFPLPLAAFADVAANQIDPGYQDAPIGQGPFRMKGQWLHDQLIEVERYPDYAGSEKPQIAGIAFRIYQTLTTQYQDLLAEQLDIVPQIPIENIAGAPADLGERYLESLGSTVQVLAFPTFDRRFANPEIRKAISMAIDRDAIVKTIFAGAQVSLRSFVAPFVPGYRENICGEPCQFDPVKARQMFEAAGGPRTVGRIEFSYNVDGGHRAWIDASCNQLRANLGVECVGNPEPRFADLLRKAEDKEPIGIFRLGWIADYPAIENYLAPLYSTNGSSNYYGYANPEFDRLLAAGDRSATPAEALTFYQQAEDLLVRDLPVAPMRYMKNTYGISTRVANVHLDPYRRVDWMKVTAAP